MPTNLAWEPIVVNVTSISGLNSSSFDAFSISSILDKQMQPVSDLLGMSVSDTHRAMATGKTLADLAADKKISETDLEAAIATGLKNNTPAGAQTLSDSQLSTLATAIANGKAPAAFSLSNKTLLDYISEDSSSNDSSNTTTPSLAQMLQSSGSTQTTKPSLETMAKALGIDVETLTKQLQSSDNNSLRAEVTAAYGTSAGIQFDSAL